jgi:hypothetical protein
MRIAFCVLAALGLLAQGVQAQPLPPGKPAGVHQASLGTNGLIVVVLVGTAILVGGLGVTLAGGSASSGTAR